MEVEDTITINEEYASKYEKKKRAEELSKRKHLTCTYDPCITNSRFRKCYRVHTYILQYEISMETLD